MKKALLIGASYLLPVVTFAQGLQNVESNIVRPIGRIINLLIPIVFALALLYFFYGLAQYILHAGEEAAQDEGKRKMIWGIVALFVMSAVWGLVRFLGTALSITPGESLPNVPSVPGVPQ
jgi:hypothetical protein